MTGFLNRRRHLDRLSGLFDTVGTEAGAVVIASGAPGVGKSALLREAARLVSSRYCYVYCDRKVEGAAMGLPLPELLQRRLSALAKENGFLAYDAFDADKRWLKTFVRGGEAVGLVAAKALLPGFSADFVVEGYQQARASLSKREPNSRAAVNLGDQRLVYVLAVLEHTRSIIHVDHAQELDDNELEMLVHLVDQTKALLFLEYVARDGFSNHDVPSLLADRPLLVLPVERLETEYADRLFASLPERFANVLREQFIKSGDLRPFDQAVSRQSRKRGILEVFDITEDNWQRTIALSIEKLDEGRKVLLVALSAHAGPVDRALLQEFVDTLPASAGLEKTIELEDAIDEFDDSLLVILTATDVMCQARVSKRIDLDSRLSIMRLTFRKYWRDFYRDLPARQLFVSDEDRCRQLLHQCAELNDFVGIGRTLEDVGKRGIATRNPRSIVTYLQGIIEKLKFAGDRRAFSRIALSQALFFYQAGWFDEALTCLLMVEVKNRRYQYLLAELYSATEHHAKGIRLAEDYLGQLDINAEDTRDSELCLRLIIMHAMRNSNQADAARAYYLSMFHTDRFAGLDGYTTLLRYSDLCLFKDEDQPLCLQYLQQAASIARNSEQWDEYASVCLSLVQQLGYTNALDEADAYLSEVESIAQELWLQHATLLANRAVLSMYRGTSDLDDLKRLKQALVLSFDPLDRMLIQINILVWHAAVGDFAEAARIALPIYRSAQNKSLDTEIRRIALYNLGRLEQALGNEEKATTLSDLWISLDSGIDAAYWRFRREGTSPHSALCRRYQMIFHPVFLAHWHTGLVPFNAIADDV